MPINQWLLFVTPKAEKQLSRLPAKQAVKIHDGLRELLAAINPPMVAGILKLQGFDGLWRQRQGDYRVVFALDTEPISEAGQNYKGTLIVVEVLKRNEGTYRLD